MVYSVLQISEFRIWIQIDRIQIRETTRSEYQEPPDPDVYPDPT